MKLLFIFIVIVINVGISEAGIDRCERDCPTKGKRVCGNALTHEYYLYDNLCQLKNVRRCRNERMRKVSLISCICLIPQPCNNKYKPVCGSTGGSDGKLYDNRCKLVVASRCNNSLIRQVDIANCGTPSIITPSPPTASPICRVKADVGFILDSSGSLRYDYQKEKDFLKALAASFGISSSGTHIGVVTFSNIARHSIKMKDHSDIESFDDAVDAIPLMGSITMIDKALRLAQNELFTVENGGRSDARKILILLTDGVQTAYAGHEEPAEISEELRRAGISVIVVGIGSGTNAGDLDKMAGGSGLAFSASSFRVLVSKEFIGKLIGKTCTIAKAPPAPVIPKTQCTAPLDVGFVLDSSGSLKDDYQKEKNFLKALAASFGVSPDGSHIGVVKFSSIAQHSIKMKDYTDLNSFKDAVDALPLLGLTTRIDRALRLAQQELFAVENGARSNIPNILILLTDGVETPYGDAEDPGDISDELRRAGITVIVVGIGSGTNSAELDKMAGGEGEAFSVSYFPELLSKEFIAKLSNKACAVGNSAKRDEMARVLRSPRMAAFREPV